MKPITVSLSQAVWDCRWSRPGYRLTAFDDAEQPETVWVCIRHGERRPITAPECEVCPHWQADTIKH